MNRRTFVEVVGAAVAVTALSACGTTSSSDERRFANEPTPTGDIGGGPALTATPAPVRATATSAPEISRQALLQVRGMVSRIVLLAGSECWSMRFDGSDVVRFGQDAKQAFTEVEATPDGASIATITSASDGAETVAIHDAKGLPIRQIDVPAAKKAAPASRASFGRLAWNTAGDRLLYAKLNGGIDSAGRTGDPSVMVAASQAAYPKRVTWSPRGDAIAFVSRQSPTANDGLYVGATSSLPVDAAELIKPNAQPRSISQIAWLQDGMRILFTRGSQDGNDALSGDIFEVMASGDNAKLLVSAGLAAPVSAIGLFAVSTAGEAIAFTVLIPNGTSIDFHSLWVKPLGGGSAVRIETSTNTAVTGLWWTEAGLTWCERVGSLDPAKRSSNFELRRLTLDGKGTQVFASAAVRSATPAASPATGSPPALPVASPAGSPTRS